MEQNAALQVGGEILGSSAQAQASVQADDFL
jgi:hypothetical protein